MPKIARTSTSEEHPLNELSNHSRSYAVLAKRRKISRLSDDSEARIGGRVHPVLAGHSRPRDVTEAERMFPRQEAMATVEKTSDILVGTRWCC